ncbi:EboA domain-containing protein [Agromyces allii]|uniref:Sugar phosphate isomerase n=1 Tax=Agromyces allii TaxID=393607 RepID=A0ABP5C880_9MICO|nr:EboA domain-containing protein [Agromyces allii]
MNHQWTEDAVRLIAAEPDRIAELFPAAGREVGRAPLAPDTDPLGLALGTADDLAREVLVGALLDALPPAEAAAELADLYRYGDDAEQRGVLRGLSAAESAGELAVEGADVSGGSVSSGSVSGGSGSGGADVAGPPPAASVDAANLDPVVTTGLHLVAEALRTNDPRLVAAALGPFAAAHLDQHSWRHGVLKALFMGIPLDAVAGLDRRTDAEVARMAAGLVAERRAASRDVTDDMTRLAAGHETATTENTPNTTDPTED